MTAYLFLIPLMQAIFLLVIGLPMIWMGSRVLRDYTEKNFSTHASLLINHVVFYGGVGLLGITLLSQLGFQMSALLGAAGIFGIAIGFASQTSVANVISGIFLLMERSFRVGDEIICKEYTGKIESIDLLSVRLRTTDGRLIRLPNEKLIKKIVINNSFYHQRRLTFLVTFPRELSMGNIIGTLKDVAARESFILRDPAITFHIKDIYPWGSKMAVQFWVEPKDTVAAAASFMENCSKAFPDHIDKLHIFQKK